MRPHPLSREFAVWQWEFEETVPWDMKGFDWRRFNAEGLALARLLKLAVGNTYRVIYEKASEDPDENILCRREVMEDGDLVELATRRQVNDAAKAAKEGATA